MDVVLDETFHLSILLRRIISTAMYPNQQCELLAPLTMLYHYAKVRMMQGDADALTEARAALNRLINMPADNVLVASFQALAPQATGADRWARSRGAPIMNCIR